MFQPAKRWARTIKRDAVVLWLAARDPRVPRHARVIAATVAAYALSPIDLIPDFIPVLGYLDDLVIVPAGVLLALWLIPADLLEELRDEATRRERPSSRMAALVIAVVWVLLLVAVGFRFTRARVLL